MLKKSIFFITSFFIVQKGFGSFYDYMPSYYCSDIDKIPAEQCLLDHKGRKLCIIPSDDTIPNKHLRAIHMDFWPYDMEKTICYLLADLTSYNKPEMTFEDLDLLTYEYSANELKQRSQELVRKLSPSINQIPHRLAKIEVLYYLLKFFDKPYSVYDSSLKTYTEVKKDSRKILNTPVKLDIPVNIYNPTYLHMTVAGGDFLMVVFLVTCGADINKQLTHDGNTPLHVAYMLSTDPTNDIITFLESRPELDRSIRNNKGQLPHEVLGEAAVARVVELTI